MTGTINRYIPAVCLLLLALMRERVAARLPERFATYLLNFTGGLFDSLGRLPWLILSTLVLWLLEEIGLGCEVVHHSFFDRSLRDPAYLHKADAKAVQRMIPYC